VLQRVDKPAFAQWFSVTRPKLVRLEHIVACPPPLSRVHTMACLLLEIASEMSYESGACKSKRHACYNMATGCYNGDTRLIMMLY
jgi:hypothetical protein